ncbi:MAG: hypothetical protein M3Y21_05200 [Candidatus Eremiobacteraeota bacterium]|nr:hypothetical protein [Candidatus Eremiobacteraeota bacterium]
MAKIISGILGNLPIVFFVIALFVAFRRVRFARKGHKLVSVPYIFWGEILFYAVGLGFLWGGIFHAFFQQTAAPSIGWQPSPFEWELGWAEIGVAVVALMSLARGFEFRLATTLIFGIFSFAAAFQHIHQIVCCRNFAPGNAGPILWFGDLFLPLLLFILALLSRDAAQTRLLR